MPSSRRRIFPCLSSAALFILLPLAGCAVDQKKEVELYRSVLDSRIPHTDAYEGDEPLSLQRAMRLANQNNETLGIRGEDYVQALISKNRAVAAFLPTVSFQPSFTIEQSSRGLASTSTGPGGTGIGTGNTGSDTGSTNTGAVSGGGYRKEGQTFQRLEAPVVGNINLFHGFGDIANVRSAEAIIRQRRELLFDVQATVLLNVAQVYYQVLRSEDSARVLRDSLRLQESRLALVEQQFKNGLAIRLSVEQTRAQVAATHVLLIQAESDVRNGRSTLAQVLSVDAVSGELDPDSVGVPTIRRAESDYEAMALMGREDLIAARHQIEAAREAVNVYISEYYPSVSLNVNGFLYREFYADASKWSAILSANLPIFSAGIIEANVRAAWSRLRQAALNESAIRRQVLNDVQQAYENLETSERRIKKLEDEVSASQEALIQAQNAFANNLAINLDVLVAQNDLLNSRLQLTSAGFDRTIFYIDLIRAVGRIYEVAGGPTTNGPTTVPTTFPTTTPDVPSIAPTTNSVELK